MLVSRSSCFLCCCCFGYIVHYSSFVILCQENKGSIKEVKQRNQYNAISYEFLFTIPEYDPYVECAGRVSRTCYTEAKKFWDDRSNILDVFLTYIDCYGEKTPECNGASIAEHMNDIIQAFGRHLEEKKGLLGQMIKNIDHSYN